MMTSAGRAREVISFGSFSLIPSERLLTREDAPVELSARALDILIALLSNPNEVVNKSDLLSQVWPDVTVEEASLRFHVANLRKVLGDGKDGARYITTLPGRGYCFVAPISRSSHQRQVASTVDAHFRYANLPGHLGRMVDRVDDLRKLSARLNAERFVTIVGSGGVGKTTLAVAIGHELMGNFAGAVLFVDLGMLSDPNLVATVVASMLGISVQSDDATPSLIAHLRDKRILLILDTCEHLIETVAALASTIFASAPQVHILATSRETLQAGGEHVYRLEPLECPPDDLALTAAFARTFPATQLFLERALSSGAQLEFGDAEAAIVASMCRKLDGVALAIELAARRIEAYGVHQTAELLDQRLTLLWAGPRTAPPRQKTLQATMDWSFSLLTEVERTVLRRLAVFVGYFTLDAVLAVVASASIDQAAVFSALDSLVAKSMVATRPVGAMMRYRLLDTTRAYALDIRMDDAEFADLAVRHAIYYRHWLEQTGTEWATLSTGAERAPHLDRLNSVRAALEWCFGVNGNAEIGVDLAAAAAPVFWAMSLLPECHRWSQRAILALDDARRGGSEEMRLQAGLGTSLMNIQGKSDAALAALNRSLTIAEELGDSLGQIGLLGVLHVLYVRSGDFKTALHYAKRSSAVAGRAQHRAAIAFAHCMLGRALLLMGDIGGARAELEASLQHWSNPERSSPIYLSADRHYRPGIAMARTLWLQGYPDQAVERVHKTLKEVADHPVSLTGALTWAIGVFFWAGDLRNAETHIDWFISRSEAYSLGPNLAVGLGLKAQLAIRQGDAVRGVAGLNGCLEKIRAARHGLLITEFNISLVQGLAAIGRFDEGTTLIGETIQLVEANGDVVYMPELLRLKGSLLLSKPQPSVAEAELCFARSLELSRRQGARAWELRTATDLATLFTGQGQPERGRALLQPVFEQFAEGFDTADLRAAKSLLLTLR
ncbi:ATP-binding protein [Bradyrhizobium sp.]|jgi:predicted ATPase/DNA-binding winged helix-turn-helix (wHTH) protein|uniref:ATP-binding protein n=1 Tax=Bradyrhizobium sp. TaxID=376 RepID=UPI0039C88610